MDTQDRPIQTYERSLLRMAEISSIIVSGEARDPNFYKYDY